MDKKDIVRGKTYYSLENGEVVEWFAYYVSVDEDDFRFVSGDGMSCYDWFGSSRDELIPRLVDSKKYAYIARIAELTTDMAILKAGIDLHKTKLEECE